MPSTSGYPWVSLTRALEDKNSPLREYLGARFPNRAPLQAAYRAAAGPIRVVGGDANPGTLGAAFDFLVRFVLDPLTVPGIALAAFPDPDHRYAISRLITTASGLSDCRYREAPEPLRQAVWALALCTEVFRAGMMPGSPLQELLHREDFTTEALLSLAPDSALDQLQQLHMLAASALYLKLPDDVPYSMGPTFDASALCAADADFIVGGQLVEVKVRLGSLNTKGERSDGLSLEDIYQMLGYVLFDRSNQYDINRITLYSARYGQLTTWPVSEFVRVLSGEDLDLAAERATVWELLGGDPGGPFVREHRSPVEAPVAPDDIYVDVLEAAEGWYQLVEQGEEPTDEDWTAASESLESAVAALRELEAAGAGLRDEPWGGTREQVVAVIDAAIAWYMSSMAKPIEPTALDEVFDRLGDAVESLRRAEER